MHFLRARHPLRCLFGLSLIVLGTSARAVDWQEFGPAPQARGAGPSSVSGRVSALGYSPDIDGRGTAAFFVGAAGGGVWRSTDFETGSPHWTPLTDNLGLPPNVENGAVDVGSIAVDPFHPNIIYVGTGEPNFSADSRYGPGILKSVDGGDTWTLLGYSVFRQQSISKIFVDPTDTSGNTLYCSMVYGAGSPSTSRGIFKSVDGGVGWTRVSGVLGTATVVTDMDYTVTTNGALVIYAGVRSSGVWRSTDNGATWIKWNANPTSIGRISLAADHTPGVSPAVYAVIEGNAGDTGTGPKVYKTQSHGASWVAATDPGKFAGGQGWYDLSIAQGSDGRVTLGGVSYPFNGGKGVLESVDGGATWVAIDVGTNGYYPHTDHHAFLWVNGRLYNGNDGGIFRFTPIPGATRAFQLPVRTPVADAARLAGGLLDAGAVPDVAVTQSASNTVSILLGAGNGTFAAPVPYPVGAGPVGVAIGHVTEPAGGGDIFIHEDVVTANKDANTVSVLIGNGDGTFQPSLDIPVDIGPVAVAIADMNNDQIPDIVTANETANSVSIVLQNADGTFQPPNNVIADLRPSDLAIADVDGNGFLDVATANAGSGSVAVLTNDGAGNFTRATYTVGSNPLSLVLADVTGDGKPDIVAAAQSSNWVAILPNTGSSFGTIIRYFTDTSPSSIAVAEVTGDAYPDIITANKNGKNDVSDNSISVLPGQAGGTFGARQDYEAGPTPVWLIANDFNVDARQDLAVVNAATAVSVILYGPTVLPGGGPGLWETLNTNGLGTIQIQGVALHPTLASTALEGSQDNGTARRTGSLTWSTVSGGDGGIVRYDPANGNFAYKVAPQGSFGTTQFFQYSANGGVSWSGRTDTISGDTTFPLEHEGGPMSPEEMEQDTAFPFYPYFTVNPDDGMRLAIGSTKVYQSTNRALTWAAISGTLAGGSQVSSLAYAPGYPGTLYAGFNNGGFYSTANANATVGVTWTSRSHPWGSARVSGITVDPGNPNTVYVAISTSNAGRIWKSTNAGASWSNISGTIPFVPAQSIALDARTGTLYVGMDLGVWANQSDGGTWIRFGDELPNAQVVDVQLNTGTNLLAAGTHGRGAWAIGVLPGDINGDRRLDTEDAALALGIWGGLTQSTTEDIFRGNIAPASPGIQLDDIVTLLRTIGNLA